MPDYQSNYTGPEIDERLGSVPGKVNKTLLTKVIKMIAPLWEPNSHYEEGDHVAHDAQLFICKQSHDSEQQFLNQYWEPVSVGQYLGDQGLVPSAVLYTHQNLSAAQKAQARANIDALENPIRLTTDPQYKDVVYKDSAGNYKFITKESYSENMVPSSWEYVGFVELPKNADNQVQVCSPEQIKDSPKFEEEIIYTGKELDVAITGGGILFPYFFQIEYNDRLAYTRNGHFHLNETGTMVTEDGYLVQPEFAVPDETSKIVIYTNGHISAFDEDGSELAGAEIPLYMTFNPGTMREVESGIYVPTAYEDLTPFEDLPEEEKRRWCNRRHFFETGEIIEDSRYEAMNTTAVVSRDGLLECAPGINEVPCLSQGYLNVGDIPHYQSYGFDIAIDGFGYFQLEYDGYLVYSRDSHFYLNYDGAVVDINGCFLQPEFALPNDCAAVDVYRNGHISVYGASTNNEELVGAEILLYMLQYDYINRLLYPQYPRNAKERDFFADASLEHRFTYFLAGGVKYYTPYEGQEVSGGECEFRPSYTDSDGHFLGNASKHQFCATLFMDKYIEEEKRFLITIE